MESINKAIKYYYPFLSESEHAEMFDNFVYSALSEAMSEIQPTQDTDASQTIKRIAGNSFKYDSKGAIVPSSVPLAIANNADALKTANIKPEHINAFKKKTSQPSSHTVVNMSENIRKKKIHIS